MRKRILSSTPSAQTTARRWIAIPEVATVELTSEDPDFPIDTVFGPEPGSGWRAAQPGPQQIRLIFDEPVALSRIHLQFHETAEARTQEFTLRWSSAHTGTTTEIVRQQWNFNPDGATVETEDYDVTLDGVSVLELNIKPDIGGAGATASLSQWRLA